MLLTSKYFFLMCMHSVCRILQMVIYFFLSFMEMLFLNYNMDILLHYLTQILSFWELASSLLILKKNTGIKNTIRRLGRLNTGIQ